MGFELAIRVAPVDPIHQDYESRYESDFYKPGDPVIAFPIGHTTHPNFVDSRECFDPQRPEATYFAWIVCPDGPSPEVINENFAKLEWKEDFEFEVIASVPAQGKYTIQARNKNVSVSGKAALVRDKIESWLIGWGASNISFATNQVQFDFSLWNAVRSDKFWERDSVNLILTFTLLDYSSQTGIGRIRISPTTGAQPQADLILKTASEKILERGGTIILHDTTIEFEIERSNIFNKFKEDTKLKLEKRYRRRRYRFLESLVNAVVNDGGIKVYTWAELQSAAQDGMSE